MFRVCSLIIRRPPVGQPLALHACRPPISTFSVPHARPDPVVVPEAELGKIAVVDLGVLARPVRDRLVLRGVPRHVPLQPALVGVQPAPSRARSLARQGAMQVAFPIRLLWTKFLKQRILTVRRAGLREVGIDKSFLHERIRKRLRFQ